MIKELLHKFSNYGSQIRVISLIVWSGNEICGEYGVEPLPIWDHKDPKGDWEEIMTRVKGNVEWWNKQLLELGVDQAAFVSEPDHMQTTNFLHVGASRLFPCLRDGSKSL